jgi:hypothetical protein
MVSLTAQLLPFVAPIAVDLTNHLEDIVAALVIAAVAVGAGHGVQTLAGLPAYRERRG